MYGVLHHWFLKAEISSAQNGLKCFESGTEASSTCGPKKQWMIKFSKTFDDLLTWFERLGTPLKASSLFNVDETLIRVTQNGVLDVELVPRCENTGSPPLDTSVIGALLAFVSANGEVPLLFFCMKKKKHQASYHVPLIPKIIATRQSNSPIIHCQAHSFSETGYIHEEHYAEALRLFANVLNERNTPHPRVLLADNLRQHRTLDILELAIELKIILQMLTPNASHFLQPLDDKIPNRLWKTIAPNCSKRQPLLSESIDNHCALVSPVQFWRPSLHVSFVNHFSVPEFGPIITP